MSKQRDLGTFEVDVPARQADKRQYLTATLDAALSMYARVTAGRYEITVTRVGPSRDVHDVEFSL